MFHSVTFQDRAQESSYMDDLDNESALVSIRG
jgi:hypothetical protein